MYSTLRALFNYAESAELIGRTPCRKIRVPYVGAVDRPVLTPEQLDRLATHLGPDQASIMWLGVVLGLRWAEIAGLRVADLDLLNGSVTVAVQRDRRGRLVPPKSAAGRRAMAAPVWLVEELAAHLAVDGSHCACGLQRRCQDSSGSARPFQSDADPPGVRAGDRASGPSGGRRPGQILWGFAHESRTAAC
jgi:integrase